MTGNVEFALETGECKMACRIASITQGQDNELIIVVLKHRMQEYHTKYN